MPERELQLGVFVSGSGTTMQNLLDRSEAGKLKAKVELVLADRSGIAALDKAEAAGVPTVMVERSEYPDYRKFSEAVYSELEGYELDYIALAGFLSRLHVPEEWQHRILNVHPALLPAFGGKGMYGDHVHEAVLDYGCKVSGCTVHFIDEEYDHGPVIAQVPVVVLDDDSVADLRERVQRQERKLYPRVISWLAEDRVSVDGRTVSVEGINRILETGE